MASMEAVVLCPWTRSGRWRPPTCLDGRWWMVNTCHWSGGPQAPVAGCEVPRSIDGCQYVSDVINPRIQIRPTSLRVKHWSPNILEGFLIYGFNNKGSNQWSFYAYSDHPNGWDIALPSPQRTMMEVQCLRRNMDTKYPTQLPLLEVIHFLVLRVIPENHDGHHHFHRSPQVVPVGSLPTAFATLRGWPVTRARRGAAQRCREASRLRDAQTSGASRNRTG